MGGVDRAGVGMLQRLLRGFHRRQRCELVRSIFCNYLMRMHPTQAFTTPFARLITNLLYTQPTLRTSILQGLRTLLQTNLTLSQSSAPPESLHDSFGLSHDQAKENVAFLRSISGNMVSVLFNVFSSVSSEERGLTGEVIKLWMSVLPPKVRSITVISTIVSLIWRTGSEKCLHQGHDYAQ